MAPRRSLDITRVGCCGTAGLSLKAYGGLFSLMEIQSTFYRLPRIDTAERWRTSVPEGFEFTLKAFQAVTHPPRSPTWRRAGNQAPPEGADVGHMASTDFTRRAWGRTLEVAEALNAEIVVVQLPPSFEYSDENFNRMKAFFEFVEVGCTPAIEFRHGSWMSRLDDVRRTLKNLGVIIVTDPLKGQFVDQRVQYHRLHGMDGFTNYKHKYLDEELDALKKLIQDNAYVLFNNMSMREDALRFIKRASLINTTGKTK